MAQVGNWLLSAPLALIGLVLYGAMIIAAFAGWRLRVRNGVADASRSHNEEGYIVSSVMGLLALLVGFTFSLSIDRFDARKQMVLAESNAIGTTYLRTQLLPEPHRTRLSALLRDYTDNRIVLAREARSAVPSQALNRSDQFVIDLWKATVAAFPAMDGRPLSSAYISSMNEMIDMDAARQQSRRSHVPLEVFLMLIVYQVIAAAVLGYVLAGRRGRTTAALLLVLFGGTLLLVIDIDRPMSGGITEDQRPMLQLQQMMHAQPAGSFGPPPPVPGKAPAPSD